MTKKVTLPKNIKLMCARHGDTIRLDKPSGDYYCIDEFDGSYCAAISVTIKEKSNNGS